MRNDKGVNAILGVLILVAITIAIAVSVFLYIESMRSQEDVVKNITIDITEYSTDNEHLFVTFNTTNAGEQTRAHFEVYSFELIVENRIVVDEIPRGLDLQTMLIEPGNNTIVFCFDDLMLNEGYCKVELQLVTEFAVYNFEPLYIL